MSDRTSDIPPGLHLPPALVSQPRSLGPRLKTLRVAMGWTLEELSRRSGVSRSALSKIEREDMSPSYEIIQKLAEGFELPVSELFEPAPTSQLAGRRAVSRAGEGGMHQGRGYLYEPLCADLSTKRMLPFRAVIMATTLAEAGGYTRHEGEECLFVTSGRVVVHTEHYAPVQLGPGDSIYLDSRMGHAVTRDGTDPAEVFWVTCR